jgi:hypothetical protein
MTMPLFEHNDDLLDDALADTFQDQEKCREIVETGGPIVHSSSLSPYIND